MGYFARSVNKPPVTLVFICLLLLWQIGVWVFEPSPLVLPSPIEVGNEFLKNPRIFLFNAAHTLANTLVGFALAVVIGVSLAVAIVYSRFLEATLYTSLVAMNSVPKVALAPLFVIWLGTGDQSKVGMAFLIAIFAIVIDAVLGSGRSTPTCSTLDGRSEDRNSSCCGKSASRAPCRASSRE